MSDPTHNQFNGFPPGKTRMTPIPAQFFSDLLPLIDDLTELKVTLFCFWALQQKEGKYRYLTYQNFRETSMLMDGLIAAAPGQDPDQVLDTALERCIQRGTLLHIDVDLDTGPEALYFLNTARGRSAYEQIKNGCWQPGTEDMAVEILPERPTIYAIYEQHIGQLTPHISAELIDAVEEYSEAWVIEAIKLAAESNVRAWRYVRGILKRWKQEGKPNDENAGGNSGQDGKAYTSGKYADFIES